MNIKTNLNNILNLLLEKSFDLYNIHWILIFYLIFIGIIVYLVLTDNRFKTNRKILFIIIIVLFSFISLIINKAPYQIIEDLFWYSLVLNCSFIFHTLILNRMFKYCVSKNWEYLGFLISRLSFTLSLSGLLYFIEEKFIDYVYLIINKIIPHRNNKYTMYIRQFYLNLCKTIIQLIKLILLYFIIIFKNYELILLGKNNKNIFNFYNISTIIIYFIILLYISILIEIPRLYLLWIIKGLITSYKIIKTNSLFSERDYKKWNLLTKIKYILKYWYETDGRSLKIDLYYNNKFWNDKFVENYEKPYHPFFMFDIARFLTPEDHYLLDLGPPHIYNDIWVKEPYWFIYRYYPWEDIILQYLRTSRKEIYKNNQYNYEYYFKKTQCKNKNEVEEFYKNFPTWKSYLYSTETYYPEDVNDIHYIQAVKYSIIINKDYYFVRKVHTELNFEVYKEILENIKKENLC